jgi:hypothetical protein
MGPDPCRAMYLCVNGMVWDRRVHRKIVVVYEEF